ncbi:CTNA1 protein, partial [Panurus biarmicus]|nr:CTNA1 protein [Panurus biarmicus]
ASWLLECLSMLQDTRDAPGLLAAFQAFSEAVLLLSHLTAKRLQELGDCPRGKNLAQALQLLHKCVPFIHTAKHSTLTHSSDCQADLSQDSVFQLTERTIRELLSLLMEPQDRSGIFSQQVSRLQALLSHPNTLCLSEGRFSSHLEAVILHGMLLAESSRLDLQLELVERCWVLLQLRRSICSHMSQREEQPGQSQGEQGLQRECHSLREELENLDRAALRAMLYQILDGFFKEKEPLRQLVEDAFSLARSGCFPAGPGEILRKLQPLIAAFFTQAQQMLQAANLVLARCAKAQTAREIREGMEHLQNLLARLPSLLTETSGNTTEHLQALCCAWARATDSLLHCFEETIGMREFLELSIQELAKHKEWCKVTLECQDSEGFSWHTACLTGWARWVVGATTRHVDRATDPIFRNGLLVWVEQLAKSILELGAVTVLVTGRFSCLQSQDAFSLAASSVMNSALRVQTGLDGSNHPEILSPLRDQVRSTKVENDLELSLSHTGIRTSTDEAVFQGHIQSHPSLPPADFPLDSWKGDAHPVITTLLGASQASDMDTVHAACSILLQLSDGYVEAAREALPITEPAQLQVLERHRDIAALTPQIISLATEMAPTQLPAPGTLLQMALRLSGSIRETRECLAAVAGSWNGLAQQVLGFILSGDFSRGKQALDETLLGLAGVVQVAGDIASTACSKENPSPSHVQESLLQLQAKFSHAQLNTRVFLEKAASFRESCGMEKAILELHGVRWAIGMCVLLDAIDQFVGMDILFLRELSRAVRNKAGPQSLLAAVAENSLRLQEAARLSYLSCPGDHGAGEILALREEIQVLMEALLDVSNTLLLSPMPTASLAIRFELLQRDVALRAKALLLHMERVNMEQLQLIQDVAGAALSNVTQEERERSKGFEEKANQLMADVQWVRNTLWDALETGAQLTSQPNLLSMADHLLLLTADVVGSARQHFGSHADTEDPCQGTGDPHLDSVVWYWSAKAHYLVTQLRVIHGINRDILRRPTECLQ